MVSDAIACGHALMLRSNYAQYIHVCWDIKLLAPSTCYLLCLTGLNWFQRRPRSSTCPLKSHVIYFKLTRSDLWATLAV